MLLMGMVLLVEIWYCIVWWLVMKMVLFEVLMYVKVVVLLLVRKRLFM